MYKGKLLIATPALDRDPYFIKSVVYIYEETPHEVLGIVLNKPTDLKVFQLFGKQTAESYSGAYDYTVYKGGPVSQQSLLLLHTDGWYSSNTIDIGNDMCLTSDELMFEKIAMGNVPDDFRFVSGIARWTPLQLQNEIVQYRAWLETDAIYTNVFMSDGTEQWMNAINHSSQQTFDKYF
jgi:putative transcriptional regulator